MKDSDCVTGEYRELTRVLDSVHNPHEYHPEEDCQVCRILKKAKKRLERYDAVVEKRIK